MRPGWPCSAAPMRSGSRYCTSDGGQIKLQRGKRQKYEQQGQQEQRQKMRRRGRAAIGSSVVTILPCRPVRNPFCSFGRCDVSIPCGLRNAINACINEESWQRLALLSAAKASPERARSCAAHLDRSFRQCAYVFGSPVISGSSKQQSSWLGRLGWLAPQDGWHHTRLLCYVERMRWCDCDGVPFTTGLGVLWLPCPRLNAETFTSRPNQPAAECRRACSNG